MDLRWDPKTGSDIALHVIGSAALFLQTSYSRGTKDSDILETDDVRGVVRDSLRALAGPGTDLHRRHRMYLEVVGAAVPLLPDMPVWHPCDLGLSHFRLFVLDVADVVISKLVRFHSDDRADIRAMIEGGFLDHGRAVERLQNVIAGYQFDARCDRLPAMVERFHLAERDWFGVPVTPVVLPDHVYR